MLGIIGVKVGMSRYFEESGRSLPVTVVQVAENVVVDRKVYDTGRQAIIVGSIDAKINRVNKPQKALFAKCSVKPKRVLKEFTVAEDSNAVLEPGTVIDLSLFREGQYVDVSGMSKGKGFAGTIKAHHFRGQDKTHGNSRSHRVPGSIGQRQSPRKVFKGKKMCKQLGNKKRTIQNLRIVKIDENNGVILIQGSVPGPTGNTLLIKSSVKVN